MTDNLPILSETRINEIAAANEVFQYHPGALVEFARDLEAAVLRELDSRQGNLPILPPLPEPDYAPSLYPVRPKEYSYTADKMRAYAEAAVLQALQQPGWVMVPVEPTEDMLSALDMTHSCEPADQYRAMLAARPAQPSDELGAPIDMVLHCPKCGLQHIDAPEKASEAQPVLYADAWTNPPHRSHKCHGCGHIWRPADVPTNGVAAVKTKGKDDSPIAQDLGACPQAGTACSAPAADAASTAPAGAEDTARIDWLEQLDDRFYNLDRISAVKGSGFACREREGWTKSLREAIDAARGATVGPPHKHSGDTALAVGNLIYALDCWKATSPKTAPPAWKALVQACAEMVRADARGIEPYGREPAGPRAKPEEPGDGAASTRPNESAVVSPAQPLAAWEDPRVQAAYQVLCDDEPPPNPAEHWEGYSARRIVAEIDRLSAAQPRSEADERAAQWAPIPPKFNAWWDSGAVSKDNPYREDAAAFWAFEGWRAALSASQPAQAGDVLTDALRRLWPAIEKGMRELVFTADRAGEIAADMQAIRAALTQEGSTK